MYLKNEKGMSLIILVITMFMAMVNAGTSSQISPNAKNPNTQEAVEEAQKEEKLALLAGIISTEYYSRFAEGTEFHPIMLEEREFVGEEYIKFLAEEQVGENIVYYIMYDGDFIKFYEDSPGNYFDFSYVEESEIPEN